MLLYLVYWPNESDQHFPRHFAIYFVLYYSAFSTDPCDSGFLGFLCILVEGHSAFSDSNSDLFLSSLPLSLCNIFGAPSV